MAIVHVVHCVDTEGPLHESVEATFHRIKDASGIEIKPTLQNLKKIQKKELDLGGMEDMLAMAFSERLLTYNDDWSDLYRMLDKITSEEYRIKFSDSFGNGWRYSWFVLDYADFEENPREKTFGYNSIYDRYKEYYKSRDIVWDEFQWHAHPMSIYREANRCGTSYMNSPHILQALARRLIERSDFPSAFRAGFHTERADSHWFLEQYIPYDFSNQAIELNDYERKQKDLAGGRFGDWRRSDTTWSPYHPSHDDYQIPGSCHRTIFRCLNVGTRLRLIDQTEVDKAFRRAEQGKDTILAFCDHDFRNMSYDIKEVYGYIRSASERFPTVKWKNNTASAAAREVLNESCDEIKITTEIVRQCDALVLQIKTNINSFGSQPFFVVKFGNKRYQIENLDVQEPGRQWTYTFDDDSIRPCDIEKIAIATNSRVGSGALKVIDISNSILAEKKW